MPWPPCVSANGWAAENVFQLVPSQAGDPQHITEGLRGRILFGDDLTFNELEKQYYAGAKIVLVKEKASDAVSSLVGQGIPVVVLFVVSADGRLRVSTTDKLRMPIANEGAILLIKEATGTQPISVEGENIFVPA